MEPLIKVNNLKVIYNLGKPNEVRALDGVDVEIHPQEYIVLFGPSGCGKSTLLYSILGLQKPTEGEILIRDRNLAKFPEKELVDYRRNRVGIIFQAYFLVPTLSVMQNTILPKVFGSEKIGDRNMKAKGLLERFGIYDQKDKLPVFLSGGQQQRSAIARALINDPEILLADEPVGNLDSHSAEIVLRTLKDINEKDKKTVILVTHDPRYLYYAHRVYYMKDGKIEREVTNPEKSQIKPIERKERLFTELDRIARLYPYAAQEELKAKVLTNYLTQELSEYQTMTLERTVGQLLKNKINYQDFYNILDRPTEEGGVGLYKQTARSFTRKMKKIMEEAKMLKSKLREALPIAEEMELVSKIRIYLLDGYKGELSSLQIQRLEEVIEERIGRGGDRKVFQKQLDRSFKEGGVGLNRATARRFSRNLEIILTQGKEYETF